MLVLITLLILVGLILYAATRFNRKRTGTEEVEVVINENPECCGVHEVCDAESLQIVDTKIEYFDDEELDLLAGKEPEKFSANELNTLTEVFYSMRESDVAGWLKSLHLRNIQLPIFLRDEALLVVSERRA